MPKKLNEIGEHRENAAFWKKRADESDEAEFKLYCQSVAAHYTARALRKSNDQAYKAYERTLIAGGLRNE